MGDMAAGPGRGGDKLDRALAQSTGVGSYRGQADAQMGGERYIVIADDGNVGRNAAPASLKAVDRVNREHVVVSDDGG